VSDSLRTEDSKENLGKAALLPGLPPSDTPASNADLHSIAIAEVISDFIARRAQGQEISNEQVIARHPELMPKLREELSVVAEIHKAVLLSQVPCASRFQIDSSADQQSAKSPPATSAPEDRKSESHIRLAGYTVQEELSSGGQAIVFKAIQERTGRTVAIKVMHGGPFIGSRGRTRFERESTVLACLNHPNVVSILDRGRTVDGSFFLVMDFIDGINLDSFVQKLGKDPTQIVRLFIKSARAIDDAHHHGIVHRDLKPMNILVDRRGEPHILDFGMARLLLDNADNLGKTISTNITRTGQILGTLPWTSPEQHSASPDSIDPRSDIYALGIMLFFSLAGQFPYPVSGDVCTITRHIANTQPASLKRMAHRNSIEVDGFLQAIVLKALCKSPSGRYENAGLLAADLEKWLAGKRWSLHQIAIQKSHLFSTLCLLTILTLTSFTQPPVARSKVTFLNAIGMRFVKLPTNSLMKLPEGHHNINYFELSAASNSHPLFISTTLVTQWQYIRVTGRTPARSSGGDLPVQCVSWDDAVQFCRLLSVRENRKYRLPTAAEWKLAWSVGGSSTLKQSSLDAMAWYGGNSGARLHSVAQKLPDSLGIYDMVGELRQWCSFSISRLENSTQTNAPDQSTHLVEGCDYMSQASDCLSPLKLETEYPSQTRSPFIGFRVVCESDGSN
jgi:serine/threonine protein kinase